MINAIDYFFLNIDHAIAFPLLTFICKLMTFLGEKGIIFLIPAIICILFPRTRKFGVCLFGAIACSFLFSNIILKNLVNRPRPFEWNDTYKLWFDAIKAPMEDGSSFPSGHVTAAAAGCTAIILTKGKKWLKASIIWVVLMMFSRCYLMAHHPTDVLVGLILGIGCGFASYYITKLIFDLLDKNVEKKWASWCLYFQVPVAERVLEVSSEKLLSLKDSIGAKLPEIKLPSFVKSKETKSYTDDDYDEEEIEEETTPSSKRSVKASKTLSKPKLPKVNFGSSKSTYVGKHEKRD